MAEISSICPGWSISKGLIERNSFKPRLRNRLIKSQKAENIRMRLNKFLRQSLVLDWTFNPKRPPTPEPNNQENNIRLKESSFPWKVVCSSRRNTNWEIIEPNPRQMIISEIIDNTYPFLYYSLIISYRQNCFLTYFHYAYLLSFHEDNPG